MSDTAIDVGSADWQQRRVLALLDEALVPGDVPKLKSFVTDDCRIVFPGFEGRGHAGVDELMGMLDQVFDGCPTKSYDLWVHDRRAVNVHGSLFGRMADGRRMDGTRYTDTFVFDDEGRITDWLVFNDLALLPPA
ncbi:hypothetical protein PC39_07394 [Salinisphaera sp. PC39]|uniref:nuclear transport factor 2 family protein n=1 Tax=Salinisphaera sp. PC39 TaxID=1304156 RepID=UPI00333EC577